MYLYDDSSTVVASSMTCFTSVDVATPCGGSDVKRVDLSPSQPLLAGGYYTVTVNPNIASTVMDAVGNVTPLTTQNFRAATTIDQSSSILTYAWRKVGSSKAAGNSYAIEHRKGAKASWTFSGRSVSWGTVVGPTFGKANVLIDGVRKATINNYATKIKYGVQRTLKGLPSGSHTITVQVLGKKGAKAAKGTNIAIDSFKVGKKLTTTPVLTAVGWQQASNAAATGGSYAVADLKAENIKLQFRGTGVTLLTARGSAYGKASVYVDGTLATTFDDYAKLSGWQVAQTVSGLTDGVHTVVVKVLGAKNTKSTSTAVVVDGFTVL